MLHRKIEDVMTRDVTTVGPDAEFQEIVAALDARRISALPVVDGERRILGIVSEADLLRAEVEKAEDTHLLPGLRRLANRHSKGEGHTAHELMTTPVVSVEPASSTLRGARLMDRHHVKRLPVVDNDGRLIGIVSRCDLLRTFLRPDEDIRTEIERDVLRGALWLEPGTIEVDVREAVVRLSGAVDNRSLIDIVLRLCRAVDGVESVTHTLTFDFDDSHIRPGPAHFGRRSSGR
ncbi:CBS domain-containing protein [Embleya scabrispora]|uniref:CBS domain-containing protein n=1 Tax=Embleya scabrispora TaxID=159449 RepID=UPI000475F73B|nr:CBS domain-containing protein [Embleya scabrispora]MYS79165.1 CBS domain-containing protein [Streptomyces sp. SID5474]